MSPAPPKRPGRKLLRHDRALDLRYVAGVDEVGRGCLAGPLVAAAVLFDHARIVGPVAAPLGRLNDSKKLGEVEREEPHDAIRACADCVSVICVAPSTIDREGLHRSNLLAMRRCIAALARTPDVALIDGFHVRDLDVPSRRIVKGDATSAAIAAASIVAKVTRDRLMRRLDERYGGLWAFTEHVGYATELHHERIAEHGVSDQHRRSFASIAYRDEMWGAVRGMRPMLESDTHLASA